MSDYGEWIAQVDRHLDNLKFWRAVIIGSVVLALLWVVALAVVWWALNR